MKGTAFIFITAIIFFSCTSKEISEDDILTYARARSLYAEGRFDEAAELLGQANGLPQALTLRGKALFFSDRTAEAEKLFEKAIKLRPSSLEAQLYLAHIKMEKGDRQGAFTLVEGLIADDPENIRVLRLAADLSFSRGPEGEAEGISYLDRAAAAASELSFVLLDRARIRWTSGNADGALEDLRAARIFLKEGSPLDRSIQNLENTILEVTGK
jgi:tetratricopeptide (TPR) repeat protein